MLPRETLCSRTSLGAPPVYLCQLLIYRLLYPALTTVLQIQGPAEVTPDPVRECLAQDEQQFEHFT